MKLLLLWIHKLLLVRIAISKKTDTWILDTGFKTPGDIAGSSGAIKIVKNTEIFEEVTVTEVRDLNDIEDDDNDNNVDDNDNDVDDNDDDMDDNDDDDDDGGGGGGSKQHSGEVSIRKKIWTFLST